MAITPTGSGPVIQGTEPIHTQNEEAISKLVSKEFDICYLPNDEKELRPLHEYQTVMLGENHGEESCPFCNGKIIDHLAEKWGGDLLLLVEDSFAPGEQGGQASEVKSKVECQAWGTNSKRLEDFEQKLGEKSAQVGERLDAISKIITGIEQNDGAEFLNAAVQLTQLSPTIEENFETLKEYTKVARETKGERDLHLHELVSQNVDKKIVIIAGSEHVDAFCGFLEQTGIQGVAIDKVVLEKEMPLESSNMHTLLKSDVKEFAKVLKQKIQETKEMPIQSTVDLSEKYGNQILLLGYAESYFMKVAQGSL